MPVLPKPDLVSEDPKSTGPATAHGTYRDDAAQLAAQIWDRRLLDDEGRPWDVDLECGVEEVSRRTALDPRHQCLVRATVEPDEVSARAER
jgi:hypothetical protein